MIVVEDIATVVIMIVDGTVAHTITTTAATKIKARVS